MLGDDVEVAQVSDYEHKLLDDIRSNAKDILKDIREKQKLDDELEGHMRAHLDGFTSSYVSTHKKAA